MEEKKNIFLEVAKKMNLSPLSTEAIKYLIDEKRIGLLPLIIKEIVVIDDENARHQWPSVRTLVCGK